MKTSISLKPKLVFSRNPIRTGALEKKSPEEVAGCSSCLTGHQGREEVRRDTPSTPLFLQTSILCHCSPLVKSNNDPASKEVWVMPSARVNFAAHRKGQKREKIEVGIQINKKNGGWGWNVLILPAPSQANLFLPLCIPPLSY